MKTFRAIPLMLGLVGVVAGGCAEQPGKKKADEKAAKDGKKAEKTEKKQADKAAKTEDKKKE